MKRNPHLTEAMERALRLLDGMGKKGVIVTDEGCKYLTIGDGYNMRRETLKNLLRLCLVKPDGENHGGKVERYVITEDGRQVVRDKTYVPRIITVLKQRVANQSKAL